MWRREHSDNGNIHVHPVDDVVAHELTPHCPCGPKWMLLRTAAECHIHTVWMMSHNSADGREQHE